jgi:hypothetical protein
LSEAPDLGRFGASSSVSTWEAGMLSNWSGFEISIAIIVAACVVGMLILFVSAMRH